MARLPIPGNDDSAWGTILNEFLGVSHNPDGTLRAGLSSADVVVSAVDAPAGVRALAQFLCDGTDDQVQINAAIDSLAPLGGTVQLSQGNFVCSGAVRMRRRTTLLGQGRATVLCASGTWTAYDGAAQGAVIEPFDHTIDKTHVGRLAINGRRYAGANVQGIYYSITTKDFFDESSDAAHWFHDLYIFQTAQHGFHTAGPNMRAACATRVRVYNVGNEATSQNQPPTIAHGFFLESVDSFYTQCETGSSSGHGFVVAGSNNRFTNSKAWFSDLSGWWVDAVPPEKSIGPSDSLAQSCLAHAFRFSETRTSENEVIVNPCCGISHCLN